MEAFFAENHLQAAESEHPERADAELGALLLQYLRRTYVEDDGAWTSPQADERAALRSTCHAAEVLHQLNYDTTTDRMTQEAGTWLINLPALTEWDSELSEEMRLHPSRFKTLATLNRFTDADVLADFQALLSKERDGLISIEGGTAVLDTCVVLETLLRLQMARRATELKDDQQHVALITRLSTALATELNRWSSQIVHPNLHTGRNRTKIVGERDVSYVLSLLSDLPTHRLIKATALRTARQRLTSVTQRHNWAYNPDDVKHILYAALYLTRVLFIDPRAAHAVDELLTHVRRTYRSDEARTWDFLAHTLVLRLLAARYGAATLRAHISAYVYQAYEQRYRDDQEAIKAELRHIIRERMSIDFNHVAPISGGYTTDQVYHVEFEYAFPTPTSRDRGAPTPMRTTIIVKRSTEDAFNLSVKNYQRLPRDLRDLFARQPSKAQIHKSTDNAAYFLVMEDLTDMDTLHFRFKDWDQREVPPRLATTLSRAVETICAASFRMFEHTKKSAEQFPSMQLSRLYLSQIEDKLTQALDEVPWLKNPLQGCDINGHRYQGLSHYLDSITRYQHRLSPRYLGLIHGDFHARNIMLDRACERVKFIDLDELSWSNDYLADLGTLVESVVVFRRLENPKHLHGLDRDRIHVDDHPPGSTPAAKGSKGKSKGGVYVTYPSLGRPATVQFQAALLRHIGQSGPEATSGPHGKRNHEHGGDWRGRLWLATATALLRRLAYQTDKRLAAVLYGEAIRLLDDLHEFLEHDKPLPEVPIPDHHQQEAQLEVDRRELPTWFTSNQLLWAVHTDLIMLGWRTTVTGNEVQYSADGAGQRTAIAVRGPTSGFESPILQLPRNDRVKVPKAIRILEAEGTGASDVMEAELDTHVTVEEVRGLVQHLLTQRLR